MENARGHDEGQRVVHERELEPAPGDLTLDDQLVLSAESLASKLGREHRKEPASFTQPSSQSPSELVFILVVSGRPVARPAESCTGTELLFEPLPHLGPEDGNVRGVILGVEVHQRLLIAIAPTTFAPVRNYIS
jgi:hypothetical protein